MSTDTPRPREPEKQPLEPVTVPADEPDEEQPLEPDFAEEVAPKSTEFGTRKKARALVAGEFEKLT